MTMMGFIAKLVGLSLRVGGLLVCVAATLRRFLSASSPGRRLLRIFYRQGVWYRGWAASRCRQLAAFFFCLWSPQCLRQRLAVLLLCSFLLLSP